MIPALIAAGASLAGGLISKRAASSQAADNYAAQKEFAQNGVRWKVEDARKAGIHPLYALGASTVGFAPTAVGDSLGPSLAAAGQDISRAVAAGSTAGERQQQQQMNALQLERAGLENELLRAQIAKTTSGVGGQVGPAFPSAVSFPVHSGNVAPVDLVSFEPPAVQISRGGDPSTTAGPAGPAFTEYDLGPLGKWNLPSEKASQALEDMDIAKYAAVLGANTNKLGLLKNHPLWLGYQYANRPDWVKRTEQRTGQRLIPHYRTDGKLYWWPTKGK